MNKNNQSPSFEKFERIIFPEDTLIAEMVILHTPGWNDGLVQSNGCLNPGYEVATIFRDGHIEEMWQGEEILTPGVRAGKIPVAERYWYARFSDNLLTCLLE